MYRKKWNIPRVPIDKTDDMTEYEFEYEVLLDAAFQQRIAEALNMNKIDLADGGLNRTFTMDQDLYDEIVEMSESGQYVDLGIDPDANEGKKLSENIAGKTTGHQEDQIPVDLTKLFGGGELGR